MSESLREVTGVVLAGGASTRFGDSAKTVAEFDGSPLVQHVVTAIERALPTVPVVAVQTRQRQRCIRNALSTDSVRFVLDDDEYEGPVGGLLAACREIETPWVFLSAADMPCLDPTAIRRLTSHSIRRTRDAMVPVDEHGYPEPLHACYRRQLVLKSTSRLDRDTPLTALFDVFDSVHEIPLADEPALRASTTNVNTRHDLESLETIWDCNS